MLILLISYWLVLYRKRQHIKLFSVVLWLGSSICLSVSTKECLIDDMGSFVPREIRFWFKGSFSFSWENTLFSHRLDVWKKFICCWDIFKWRNHWKWGLDLYRIGKYLCSLGARNRIIGTKGAIIISSYPSVFHSICDIFSISFIFIYIWKSWIHSSILISTSEWFGNYFYILWTSNLTIWFKSILIEYDSRIFIFLTYCEIISFFICYSTEHD